MFEPFPCYNLFHNMHYHKMLRQNTIERSADTESNLDVIKSKEYFHNILCIFRINGTLHFNIDLGSKVSPDPLINELFH